MTFSKQASEKEPDSTSMQKLIPYSKHHQLNRFLSKTYHMVSSCDPTIASWTSGGDSFIVKDADAFSSKILPLYFKHSKFSSFVRQLNFYGFRKLRPETCVLNKDEDSGASSFRFFHEYFQAGKPELLHKITRATKSAEPSTSSNEVETLQEEIETLKNKLDNINDEMDKKLATMQATIELDYQRRITHLEGAFNELVTSLLMDRIRPSMASKASSLSGVGEHFGLSPELSTRPMMNLSGINVGLSQSELIQKLATPKGFASLLNGMR